jgi:hypothetical protein
LMMMLWLVTASICGPGNWPLIRIPCVAIEKRESKSHKEQSKKKNGAMRARTVLSARVRTGRRTSYLTPRCRIGTGPRPWPRARESTRGRRGAWPSSGKKRGTAVVVGEEEGRRLWGEEEGQRLSSLSSGKKRGGGCRRRRLRPS